MRKDNFDGKVIASVYDLYQVEGLNQNRLIKNLNKGGITLYNIIKKSPSSMSFCVSVKQSKNFFAIVKKMWYTNYDNLSIKEKRKREKLFSRGIIATKKECSYDITRVKTKGRGYPLYQLKANFGVAIGVVVFLLGSFFFNDFLLGVSFDGNGKVLEREVQDFLEENGIKKYSRFSSLDLDELAKDIHQQNPMLSFVQCSKRGNKLIVELSLANTDRKTVDDTVTELKSDVNGVVTSLRVHRGTPLVKVGDTVLEGDILVGGWTDVKGEKQPINVLATVVVLAQYNHEYLSQEDNQQSLAEILAKEQFNSSVESAKVEKIKTEKGYLYKTTLYYKRYFVAG